MVLSDIFLRIITIIAKGKRENSTAGYRVKIRESLARYFILEDCKNKLQSQFWKKLISLVKNLPTCKLELFKFWEIF